MKKKMKKNLFGINFCVMFIIATLCSFSSLAVAGEITGVTVDDVSYESAVNNRFAVNTINEQGLDPITGYHTDFADGGQWTSGYGLAVADAYIAYDLGAEYSLMGDDFLVRIWNWNNWQTEFSAKDLDILVSADGVSYTALGSVTLAIGPSSDAVDYSETFTFIPTAPFQYVKLDIQSAYTAQPLVGLAEVKFYASEIPEPATMLLLAGGAIMASIRRRRVR